MRERSQKRRRKRKSFISLIYYHNDLMEDLSKLLNMQITPPAEPSESDIWTFVNKIKTRFEGDDGHVLESFAEIMKTFEEGNKPVKELHTEILSLLRGHQDLIEEFSILLPVTSRSYKDFRF